MQPDRTPSLYDRLGGVYNIATVVDSLKMLAKFQVPPAEQTELVAIVESTRDAIVVAPPLRSGPPKS